MNTEYDNSLPHQDRTHLQQSESQTHEKTDGISQRSLIKNTNGTPSQRSRQTLSLFFNGQRSVQGGRNVPIPALAQDGSNATMLPWTIPSQVLDPSMDRDLTTYLGNLFQYSNTVMRTRCCLFLAHSKYFWKHCMVTYDTYYYERASTDYET